MDLTRVGLSQDRRELTRRSFHCSETVVAADCTCTWAVADWESEARIGLVGEMARSPSADAVEGNGVAERIPCQSVGAADTAQGQMRIGSTCLRRSDSCCSFLRESS